VYRAAGADRWIAVSVLDDHAWRALAELIGATAELRDADQAQRRAREDEIDALIAAWTADREPTALAERMQAAGIPAALVATGQDLVEHDEQLAARGFYPVLEHPIAGPVRHEGIVARLTATPGALTGPAPLLGEHTAAVLGELLGLSEPDLAALAATGVTE
jgi:crotonobetainyl-CoA:carnitine CoA-transferase CaiB-like acyl-CoA transferase